MPPSPEGSLADEQFLLFTSHPTLAVSNSKHKLLELHFYDTILLTFVFTVKSNKCENREKFVLKVE